MHGTAGQLTTERFQELATAAQPRSQVKSRILRVLAYGLSSICLVWLLRDFHIVRAWRELKNVDWDWVLVGIGFDVLSYIVQAIRWKFLLAPFGKVRLTTAVRAVYAGLFANLVFPLRPGEVLRSYIVSNSEDISVGRVLGSVGVERLIDLVVATASLGVASLFVELDPRLRRAADILGVVTLVLVAIIVALILYLEIRLGKDPELASGRAHLPGRLMGALTGLHAMGTAPSFYTAVLTSIAIPGCQVFGLWAMMRAYRVLPLTFMDALVVLLVINLGVSLPNAPANVGAYQFFCMIGVNIFYSEKSVAGRFAFFAWLALNLPFVFLGFAALVRSGMSLRTMREKVSALPRQVSGTSSAS
jgi:glycosyltransferase 2 family protein